MTTAYVLMFFWMADSNWRPATLAAEFSSFQQCEAAGKASIAQIQRAEMARKATYVCVPK